MFIVGIEPKAPGLHIFSHNHMPRLGLPQLLTIAKQAGHKCVVYCEEIAPISWEHVGQADMVLISSITSTVPRAYMLMKKIKEEVNHNAPILMGGPHVTFLPEEALDNGANYVFRHEAEESFASFIQWWMRGKDSRKLLNIPGLSFKMGDTIHHTAAPKQVDLDSLPTPDLDLIYGFEKPYAIPLITSRGCPWDCDFCSEVAMFGRTYRFRSEQKVVEDIKYYDRRYGRISVFMADDNLGANRLRLERLCRSIIDNRLVRSISGQIRLDLARHPESLKLLRRAGFDRAYIGYESTNPESLKAIGKGLSFDDMSAFTKTIHSYGIDIHAMWVLGFDTDTLETVKANIRASIKWRLETIQFLILVPIPGSKLFERFKNGNRIFNLDWSRYDGHHVTFYPEKMTPRQLQVAVMLDAMPTLYNHWQTLRIFIMDNYWNALGFFKIKTWHPLRRVKTTFETLIVRVWGRGATRKMKKPIRDYLKRIPVISSKLKQKNPTGDPD
jgi:anaerobic magnesium-protoporphyrin IX monomethyl ester cyclase